MAQPPTYNRQKNFADDFGNETDHSALNAELDRASNSINDIRSNLAILQADDGKLRPTVVTLGGHGITDALYIPKVDDSADPLNISVQPNTVYQIGTVNALTIKEVTNGLRESRLRCSTGDIVPVVIIQETLKHAGDWKIEPNKDYTMSIFDNITGLEKVVA